MRFPEYEGGPSPTIMSAYIDSYRNDRRDWSNRSVVAPENRSKTFFLLSPVATQIGRSCFQLANDNQKVARRQLQDAAASLKAIRDRLGPHNTSARAATYMMNHV